MITKTNDTNHEQEHKLQFQIQKVYAKRVSFQIPQNTDFSNLEWQPELHVNLDITTHKLPEEHTFEVILEIKTNVKCLKSKVFEAELQQAGIFTIVNTDQQQLNHIKHVFCPNILYPYACEIISNIVSKGGFPQLCLAPVDFDMLYHQRKNRVNE